MCAFSYINFSYVMCFCMCVCLYVICLLCVCVCDLYVRCLCCRGKQTRVEIRAIERQKVDAPQFSESYISPAAVR